MPRRRSPFNGRTVLAAVCAVAVLLVGTDLGWGFGLSVFLAALAAAFGYALVRSRGAARPAVRSPRPAPSWPLDRGEEVVTVRNLAGASSEFVPEGSRGTIVGTAWGKTTAAFVVYGPLGTRQVQVVVGPADIRPV